MPSAITTQVKRKRNPTSKSKRKRTVSLPTTPLLPELCVNGTIPNLDTFLSYVKDCVVQAEHLRPLLAHHQSKQLHQQITTRNLQRVKKRQAQQRSQQRQKRRQKVQSEESNTDAWSLDHDELSIPSLSSGEEESPPISLETLREEAAEPEDIPLKSVTKTDTKINIGRNIQTAGVA